MAEAPETPEREQKDKLIWAEKYWGPHGAMRIAKRLYRSAPDDDGVRIAWMSDLVSALGRERAVMRRDPRVAYRIPWCLAHLRPHVVHYRVLPARPQQIERLTADQLDVVSTVLLRWAQLPLTDALSTLPAARKLALAGYARPLDPERPHTRALLALTLARITAAEEGDGGRERVREYFEVARSIAPSVIDPNQKARVLRGCAEVALRHLDRRIDARVFLDQADAVPGIGDDVKLKTVETRRALGL